MNVSQIREAFASAGEDGWDACIRTYASDPRRGVQALVAQYERKRDILQAERRRLEEMLRYEHRYEDVPYLCGIDEAGRGPLAGPVVAAAVILPKGRTILWLNDSKQLSAKRREALYFEITEQAVAIGVGTVSPARIDEINILQATYEAMQEAVGRLGVEPGLLLNDAVRIPAIAIPQVPIVKGDAKSLSVAAASVIAKVTRDRLMEEYDRQMPEYGFAQHKGYASAQHIEALRRLGPSPIHRRTFLRHFEEEEDLRRESGA